MSISVPAARLTPCSPATSGFSDWGEGPHGFGVAPDARAETGLGPCEVKTLETHSVRVQIAINWAERQGDTGRLRRLLRHGEDIDRRLTTACAIPVPALASATASGIF